MDATELQDYVDAGYVPHEAGTHEISTAVTMDGTHKVTFMPNRFVWNGSSSNGMFEYTGSGNFYPIHFIGVTASSGVSGSPIFTTSADNKTPHNLVFDACDFTSLGAYAIDLNIVDYTIVPSFRNMTTRGSGALRLRGSGGSDYWHATSQTVLRGWTHIGSNRVGPAWNLRGASGFIGQALIDRGSMSLISSMNNVWEGPISFFMQSPRTPGYIDLVTEWDDVNDDNAVNCYIGEIRTDNTTGTGKQNYVELTATMTHSAVDATVKPWRFMGGDTVGAHSLVVNLVNCASPTTATFLAGGKVSVWATRPWWEPGEDSDAATLETALEAIHPDAYQDPIETSTTKLPSNDVSSGTTYSGSAQETNYATEPGQYEDILEA